jgi:ribose-phosphate pyrophosphokinase
MTLKILAGSANHVLAENFAKQIGLPLVQRISRRFPDGELQIELQESVRGNEVFLFQPTCPP